MRISVFGIGYVGSVSCACLARDGHRITAVDIDPQLIDTLKLGQAPIAEPGLEELIASAVNSDRLTATLDVQAAIENSDASYVCVGTPGDPDGTVGLSHVVNVCRAIGSALARKSAFHTVILRSTIVPGTMEQICIPTLEAASGKKAGLDFGVGYFPEFLREGSAIADYSDPCLVVFGALDPRAAALLRQLNQGFDAPLQQVDLRSAEMIKYTSNAWRAVKISFANEIGNISKACGLDGPKIMDILCSDTAVSMSPSFLRPGFAFGGSCLPKDLRALRRVAQGKSVPTPLIEAVLTANAAQIDRAEQMIEAAGKSNVGMVGISFKPNTDDLRESPLAELAVRLINRGHQVQVYDPNVSLGTQRSAGSFPDVRPPSQQRLTGLTDHLLPDIDALIKGADVILVGNSYPETIEPLSKAMRHCPMIDLTRLSPDLVSHGTYQGICW